MRRISSTIGLLLATGCFVIAPTSASAHEHVQSADSVQTGLGIVHFPNSGAPRAQQDFLRGVLLLHSFEYQASRKAFQRAERLDPRFALAYWGEALTYNQTLWGEQDLESARCVLAKLAPTRDAREAKAKSTRERAYLNAVEQLYGEGSKAQRDASFSEALGRISRRYPDDLEARSFYALSILGLTNGVRNPANYMRAAAEAEDVFAIDRRHPGALHYLIHAYDDPVHAPLGLRAANLYGSVAPAASHALHMPSHIYFALGMWNEAIAANVASLKVARAQQDGGYHSLVWLTYAYLQENDRQRAWELIQSVSRDALNAPTKENRIRLALLHAIWEVETRSADFAESRADSQDITSIGYFDAEDFVAGIAAGAKDGTRQAALARLRLRASSAAAAAGRVAADWHDAVTRNELAQAAILSTALEAVIKYHDGDHDTGLAQLRAAIADADHTEFEYGPPWSAKPLDELAGELLLDAGRRDEAALEFEKTLRLYPNRRLAREGLAASQETR